MVWWIILVIFEYIALHVAKGVDTMSLRITVFVVLALLLVALGFAAQQQGSAPSKQGASQSSDAISDQDRDMARVMMQDRTVVQDRIQIHAPEYEDARQQWVWEQNRITSQIQQESVQQQEQARVAAQVMMRVADGDCQNGLCQQARDYQNSLAVQLHAEEQAQERSAFMRFLAGSDHAALQQMEQERLQNQERIRLMNQYITTCDSCNASVQNQLQEWVRVMNQEQERLRILTENESGKKGIFGWMWK